MVSRSTGRRRDDIGHPPGGDGDTIYGDLAPDANPTPNPTIAGVFEGHDLIYAGDGNDVVFGDGGLVADVLVYGDDTIYGGGGHDVINAGQGNDWVQGGFGNDSLVGGAENDDLVDYSDHTAGVTIDLTNDTARSGSELDEVSGFEHAVGGLRIEQRDDQLRGLALGREPARAVAR